MPPPNSTTAAEEGHSADEQDTVELIPMYIAASIGGLILLSFFVRIFICVYSNIKASLPPHARERVVALPETMVNEPTPPGCKVNVRTAPLPPPDIDTVGGEE